MKRVIIIAAAATVSIMTAAVRAQSRSGEPNAPAFEVATVKANKSPMPGGPIFFAPGGLFTATNATLRTLILTAYPVTVPQAQLLGGPSWVETERFDIQARGDANASRDDRRAMVGSLLADRFQLVLHKESRDLPTYTLVLARSDGRLGGDLRRSGETCPPLKLPPGVPAPPPPPPPPGLSVTNPQLPCLTIGGPGFLSGRHVTMEVVGRLLATRLGRLVVDQTGLAGEFDVDLVWTPVPGELPPPPPGAGAGGVIGNDSPSLFTALQEQLGLKVQPSRGQVDVFVIDRVEHPTEN